MNQSDYKTFLKHGVITKDEYLKLTSRTNNKPSIENTNSQDAGNDAKKSTAETTNAKGKGKSKKLIIIIVAIIFLAFVGYNGIRIADSMSWVKGIQQVHETLIGKTYVCENDENETIRFDDLTCTKYKNGQVEYTQIYRVDLDEDGYFIMVDVDEKDAKYDIISLTYNLDVLGDGELYEVTEYGGGEITRLENFDEECFYRLLK